MSFVIVVGFLLILLVTAFGLRATGVPGIVRSASVGAGVVGGLGFVGGFFGPMVFMPQSNLGPLLGLFITGPIGVVVGMLGGGVMAYRRHRQLQGTLL